jgi:hypothetical protein
MPIEEADPWRLQYFADAPCPAHVRIPTEDADAWLWYPKQRWVYDKLAVALRQGLEAGPHGTQPPRFPVFSKPMMNLRGMAVGSRMLASAEEYQRHLTPGHMWMTLLAGDHVSSDAAVVQGKPVWWRHATGSPGPLGTFDYWTVHAASNPNIESYCGEWIAQHLRDYTGMLNFETIGSRIIEVHLRFADQWPDLYGAGWIEALIELYETGTWRFADSDRRDGYSVVLFGASGRRYRHPPAVIVEAAARLPKVSSVQITFHEDREPEAHAMPPGGFRLAIVNAWDLRSGITARECLGSAITECATPNSGAPAERYG